MAEDTVIKVFGVGGGGGHIAESLAAERMQGVKAYAANTDAMALLDLKVKNKIILGEKITKGRSAGNDIGLGERAAKVSIDAILKSVGESPLVFVVCGLGGGTGSGGAPVICEAAKRKGALVAGFAIMPSPSEGSHINENAGTGLARMREICDGVFVFSNEKIMDYVEDLPIEEAYEKTASYTADVVRELSEITIQHGVVNLGLKDIGFILKEGRVAMLGTGLSSSTMQAAKKAFEPPLMDGDTQKAVSALVNVSGSATLRPSEVEAAVKCAAEKLPDNTSLIWGARFDSRLGERKKKVSVLVSHY